MTNNAEVTDLIEIPPTRKQRRLEVKYRARIERKIARREARELIAARRNYTWLAPR